MSNDILDVDLLAFERGDAATRRAVVDGVRRSLASGFVYTSHDLGEGFLDDVYATLAAFFSQPIEDKRKVVAAGSNGQAGYTGLLVETAATSDVPDWKEMLNWGRSVPDGHPLRRRFPQRYMDPVLPPGSEYLLLTFHDRLAELNRRFLRIIALGIGCDETFFDRQVKDGTTLTRAIRYPAIGLAPSTQHVWAAEHGDINLITALPRASAPGLQVKLHDATWVDAVAPAGQAIINTGMMLEHITNGLIPTGIHRVVAAPGYEGERYSVVQFCHPTPWTILQPVASCITAERPQRYGAMPASDRLDEVLYEINLVEDGRRVS